MSHGHSGLGSTGDRTFNETPPTLGGISGSEVQMAFMTRKLVGDASISNPENFRQCSKKSVLLR